MPALADFSLVGGTALSLRYGHRNSIDIDLFYHHKFDHSYILKELELTFGQQFDYRQQHTHFGIFCFIHDVKVDLVHYPHEPLLSIETIENIRFYSDADIAAMKIQAILGRGKKKDFWDLFELLQNYSLEQIMSWHTLKFPSQMLAISIPHALTYFTDADETDEPRSFKNQTWEGVKRGIQKAVRDYLI
jgi:predicted nucleotidyltransferase component of viral defense system